MGLQRDIVIKNQFSVKRGGVGTKGNTPGDFVLRYMARDGATETLTPIMKRPIDTFITRYMARKNATETVNSLGKLHSKFRQAQGLGGRSFGKAGRKDPGRVSLSDIGIKQASRVLQKAFDDGKTVMEDVISFDGNYLENNNIADKSVPLDSHGHALSRGAFRGHVDQLKLRLAIMNGLARMASRKIGKGRRFEDLAYVGVIQVDTQQVHCHLAMADLGRGQQVLTEGRVEQKGCLNLRDRMTLRRGIDDSLDEYQRVRQLTAKESLEKQNTRSFVKSYTQRAMRQSSFGQIIFAVLPSDKRLWRADSHSRSMRRANAIMRFYVQQVLDRPKSGYRHARSEADGYAYHRMVRENLKPAAYQKLIKSGHRRIVNSCINAVYGMLKKVPDKLKNKRTKLMDSLGASLDLLAARQHDTPPDPSYEFSFHLRSYSKRLAEHREQAEIYHQREEDYKKQQEAGKTKPISLPVLQFYQEELRYQNKALSKYELMLPLLGRTRRWRDQLRKMQRRQRYLRSLRQAQQDRNMDILKGKALSSYAKKQYNLSPHDANLRHNYPTVFASQIKRYGVSYQHGISDLQQTLFDNNLTLKFAKDGKPLMSRNAPYDFEDVKAVDLQDTADDFTDDRVSRNNVQAFLDTYRRRSKAFAGLAKYAQLTGQMELIDPYTQRDIARMGTAAKAYQRMMAPAVKQEIRQPNKQAVKGSKQLPAKKTISMDVDLSGDIRKQIKRALRQVDASFASRPVRQPSAK